MLAQAVGAGEALCAQRARVRPVSAVCGHVSAQVSAGAERPVAQVAAERARVAVRRRVRRQVAAEREPAPALRARERLLAGVDASVRRQRAAVRAAPTAVGAAVLGRVYVHVQVQRVLRRQALPAPHARVTTRRVHAARRSVYALRLGNPSITFRHKQRRHRLVTGHSVSTLWTSQTVRLGSPFIPVHTQRLVRALPTVHCVSSSSDQSAVNGAAVGDQLVGLLEAPAADVALERLAPGVTAHVRFQHAATHAALTALRAPVLALMNIHVQVEAGRVGESLVALRAREQSFGGVVVGVAAQLALRAEALIARAALVRLGGAVSSSVNAEVLARREPLLTHRAHMRSRLVITPHAI